PAGNLAGTDPARHPPRSHRPSRRSEESAVLPWKLEGTSEAVFDPQALVVGADVNHPAAKAERRDDGAGRGKSDPARRRTSAPNEMRAGADEGGESQEHAREPRHQREGGRSDIDRGHVRGGWDPMGMAKPGGPGPRPRADQAKES